jgi:hypothetical protein
MKKCWPIIKHDFYKLCNDFYNETVNLESLNDGFITLVPKISNPETISDYRPISLLNCSLKLLTKLLADRLSSRSYSVWLTITNIDSSEIGPSRTVLLGVLNIYISASKVEEKRYFEKAFNMVEHVAILQVLRHMGFPDKWLFWIHSILSMGTSAVILNGVLGKKNSNANVESVKGTRYRPSYLS